MWSIIVVILVQEDWTGAIGLVYGSCEEQERRTMFQELCSAIQNLECPCVIIRDFNEILNISYRGGQSRVTSSTIEV